jgi:hypothetical protein
MDTVAKNHSRFRGAEAFPHARFAVWGLWLVANGLVYAQASQVPMWAALGFGAAVLFTPVAYYRTRGDEGFVAYISALVVLIALMASR